jgi:ribosome-binding factor A
MAAAGFHSAFVKRFIMVRQTARQGPTQRQLRVGELLRHTLANVFAREEIADPDLASRLITVCEVKVSSDLKHATAYVTPTGGGDAEKMARDLNRHQRFLRGLLARRVELRYVPELIFKADVSIDEAQRIESLLRSPHVRRDL